ncbi:MAG: hypothetical protein LBR93_06415 [Treponema sp.]|nr:hypothetical protein [Treponema sp.]
MAYAVLQGQKTRRSYYLKIRHINYFSIPHGGVMGADTGGGDIGPVYLINLQPPPRSALRAPLRPSSRFGFHRQEQLSAPGPTKVPLLHSFFSSCPPKKISCYPHKRIVKIIPPVSRFPQIVKKAPELVIEKNIARIFKRINVLEYKSPEDYFSVYDFYKVLSYAYLYAALNKTP